MKVMTSVVLRAAVFGMVCAAAPLQAQTVTPANPNGWIFYDGAGPGTDPATITNAKPYNGNGSLQFTVSASNQQPSAAYLFGAPVALSGLNSLSLGYSFLTPNGTVPAASPTIRLLLTGITNGHQPGTRSDGSLGWYLNGSSDSWQTQSLSLTSGDFFFRIGGVGQAANDCNSTGSSFDDRRQTINAFKAACSGADGKININTASIVGVQVDWGTFVAPGTATAYADQVNFSIGANNGNYNFETTSVVPEPASVALLGFGMVAIGFVARKRKQQSLNA
jgi:hypothetical protein